MILEYIFHPILGIMGFILNCIPLLTLPADLIDSIGALLMCWNRVNSYVPVNYILILFGGYWVLVQGKLAVAVLSWVYEKIPFI